MSSRGSRSSCPRVYTHDHLSHGVPDLRIATLPARYDDLLKRELPLEREEIERLRAFAPRFAELCDELIAHDVSEPVQHDDLHMSNVYTEGEQLRVLDWGDSSISHPFVSLVVTFRFLEEVTKPPLGRPSFAQLRDAYLELGRPASRWFPIILRRAIAQAISFDGGASSWGCLFR
jgi:aminoglycoside phosphotransferase (APT) family kinase protein